MAKRLLRDQSQSMDAEESMLNRLKVTEILLVNNNVHDVCNPAPGGQADQPEPHILLNLQPWCHYHHLPLDHILINSCYYNN